MATKPSNDWIEWAGGECPVVQGVAVDVRHRDGEEYFGHEALISSYDHFAADDWTHSGADGDIIAYRVVSA